MARFRRDDPERIKRLNALFEAVRNDTTEYSDDDEDEIDENDALHFFKHHATMLFDPPSAEKEWAKDYKQILVEKNMWTEELEKEYKIITIGW